MYTYKAIKISITHIYYIVCMSKVVANTKIYIFLINPTYIAYENILKPIPQVQYYRY